jgi:hypothetical protein
MNAFDAELRRSFAEMDEPLDDGFSVSVTHRVAGKERSARAIQVGHQVAVGAAAVALAFGGFSLLQAFGPELMASVGLELARAHGALSQAEGASFQPMSVFASFGGALTQLLLAAGAAAGGVAAFRAVQE